MSSNPPRSRSRWLVSVVMVVVGLLLGAGITWAVLTVLRPAESPLDATPYTYVTVAEGEVGASMVLNAVAEWTSTPAGVNQASGIVTDVRVAPGDEVSQGSVLYTVGLRPVVIAQGAVPAFRAIGAGTVGADVQQLQQLLTDLGFFTGSVNGTAGTRTAAAIEAWQKALGVPVTGTVDFSDVIFVPALPTRVSLDTDVIARGNTVGGGEKAVLTLPAAPAFTMPVTTLQAGMIPSGTSVQITAPDGAVWSAVAGDQISESETDTVSITLLGAGGAPPCADACAQIPVTGQTLLSSQVVTIATTAGLVVPSAALTSSADGTLSVVDETGVSLPVTVIASAKGMSVVEGVDAGTTVRLPATTTGG